jgi:glutamine synthetase
MNHETRTPPNVLALCRELDVKIICLKFTDLLGRGRAIHLPFSELREESFEYGFSLDANTIRLAGVRRSSELLLVPEPATSFFDPFSAIPTLNILCTIQDPITGEGQSQDPRSIATNAMSFMVSSGFAEKVSVGVDLEFHLVAPEVLQPNAPHNCSVHATGPNSSAHYQASDNRHEVTGNYSASDDPGLNDLHFGDRVAAGMGDSHSAFYCEMLKQLIACRVRTESRVVRCSAGAWFTVGIRGDDLVRTADSVMVAKYVIRRVASRFGKIALFLPKWRGMSRTCGMPISIQFSRGGDPLFSGSEYGGLSPIGLGGVGGLLKHTPSLCGLASPSTNSYRRLSDPRQSPNMIGYSKGNDRMVVRIPDSSSNPKSKRIEFRCSDATSNPYIAISGVVMAIIEGAQNKTDPGQPLDFLQNDSGTRAFVPTSLESALSALEIDHDYLTRGEVFSLDFIETWIECKRALEVAAVNAEPHPIELEMYEDL